MTYQLWGSPNSLYTGKVRSYLIKQRIPFENRAAGEARFREKIVPQIGRWIVPVLEAENGALVQDGSDIIAHLEGKVGVACTVIIRKRCEGQVWHICHRNFLSCCHGYP